MGPNFANPVLDSDGNLVVSGTFDTHGSVIDDVLVRFLIIPEGNIAALTDPLVGTATIPNASLTPVGGDPACKIQHGNWSATVPNKFGLPAGAKARGIGISVAVKRSDPPGPVNSQDAPALEAFTWCVNLEVQPPARAA